MTEHTNTETSEVVELSAVETLAKSVGADPKDDDFLFGCYVYCMDYHDGQWSLEYEAISTLKVNLRDNHIAAIRVGKHDKSGEWEMARQWYRKLKRAYTLDD